MKAMLILIVLGVLAVGAVYYVGRIASMDPVQQAEAFCSEVKPGMTWEQVVDLKQPRKYYQYNPDPRSHTGKTVAVKFNRDIIAKAVKEGS